MSHHKPNIIKELRSMLPRRPLDMAGARAVAEAQALRLLQLLDIKGPAVDVGLLTMLPRISVEVGPDLQGRYLSGESGWDRGRWLIRISRKDSLTRRRFTLAHEFKHILDGPAEKHVYGKLGVGDEDDHRRCIEEIADYFAASLLMPRLFVTHALRTDVRNVYRLAALFMVSPVAMSRRLRDLGLGIEEPDDGQDPVLRYFRKAAISVSRRRLRLADGVQGRPVRSMAVRSLQAAGEPPVGGPVTAAADADQPCRSALTLLTITEAGTKLRVSRWSVYRLIHERQLETIKIGARRLVPCRAIRAFIEQQAAEGKL